MSVKWQTGPRRPIKKIPRYIWTGFAMLYVMLWRYAIIHAAEKTLSGNPPGDMPVIVIIGVLIIIGAGLRARQVVRARRMERYAREGRRRRYG